MVNKYAYDEFGNVLNSQEAVTNPFKYVGQFGVMDEGYGLSYMRARYYDRDVGRFISKDPIGYRGGINLYGYVTNNPVNWSDPFGLTRLVFDVKQGVLWIDPERPNVPVYSIPATSGTGECMNVPKCEDKENIGPIPRGNYAADISQLTNPGLMGDIIRNILGDWGDWRVPLKPSFATKRSGFFLHGGRDPGSEGCIDIGGGIFGNSNTDRLLKDLLADPDKIVPIVVR
jgi:RHS repeat-associated protein